eukprot:TRINITY_DN4136_c0_g1_i1.p1 TRINITY_DN4136_c0_g1~~TRINITY_DN4136_c0_g1_i1.p1  ORF type:complete len:284 (-),score=20.43 TRINITY_DN4136_c0_g1_i1:530-1276(-)
MTIISSSMLSKAKEMDARLKWAEREQNRASKSSALLLSGAVAAGPQMFYSNLPSDIWGLITPMLRPHDAAKLALASRSFRPFILSQIGEIKVVDLNYWGHQDDHTLPPLLQTFASLAQTRFGCRLRSLQIPSSKHYIMIEAIELADSLPYVEELLISKCPVEKGLISTGTPRRKPKSYAIEIVDCLSRRSFSCLKSLSIEEILFEPDPRSSPLQSVIGTAAQNLLFRLSSSLTRVFHTASTPIGPGNA